MPANYPSTNSHIVFTVHVTDPSTCQGYVTYRWHRPGYSPDPMGSQPLAGNLPHEVIAMLRRAFGHTNDQKMEIIQS